MKAYRQVAVIGAGMVGVSTALWLQRMGCEVTLIDREGPAAGASTGNAGIIAAPGWENRPESNDKDWDMIYDVNVRGVARVTESAAVHMKKRRYGKIINIASVAGRQGSPANPPYHVSKAGVISLTQASALGLAPFNINVNAICPGNLWTPMWERIATRQTVFVESRAGLTPRQAFEASSERIPLGREQTPEDVAYLAVFLASEYAQNITGQAINVNGGARMD